MPKFLNKLKAMSYLSPIWIVNTMNEKKLTSQQIDEVASAF